MDEKEVNLIRSYLLSNSYPDGFNKSQKRALRQKCESFAILEDELRHKGSNNKLQKVRAREKSFFFSFFKN